MATVLPAFNPVAGVAQAIGPVAQLIGQRRQQQEERQRQLQLRQQQQRALQRLGGQFGLKLPQGLSPQLGNLLVGQAQQAGLQPTAPVKGVSQAPGARLVHPVTGEEISPAVPQEATPSQQISQIKLDFLTKLQAKIDSGNATEKDINLRDKILGGVSPVQIDLGKTSASERTAISGTEASLNTLDNLESLFNMPETRTGPVVGRVDPALGLVGKTTKEQENFMAATQAFTNSIIKEITGAQMSEVEAKRIKSQIPLITDPPARWKAKLAQTRRNLKVLQQKRSDVLKGAGIKSPLDSPGLTQDLQSGAGKFGLPGFSGQQQQASPSQNKVDAIGNKFGF